MRRGGPAGQFDARLLAAQGGRLRRRRVPAVAAVPTHPVPTQGPVCAGSVWFAVFAAVLSPAAVGAAAAERGAVVVQAAVIRVAVWAAAVMLAPPCSRGVREYWACWACVGGQRWACLQVLGLLVPVAQIAWACSAPHPHPAAAIRLHHSCPLRLLLPMHRGVQGRGSGGDGGSGPCVPRPRGQHWWVQAPLHGHVSTVCLESMSLKGCGWFWQPQGALL